MKTNCSTCVYIDKSGIVCCHHYPGCTGLGVYEYYEPKLIYNEELL